MDFLGYNSEPSSQSNSQKYFSDTASCLTFLSSSTSHPSSSNKYLDRVS